MNAKSVPFPVADSLKADALALLRADAPWGQFQDSLMTYGRFIGSWDVESIWYKNSGELVRMDGEWHFSWILGGRGVVDVLFGAGFTPDRYGTTLRYYDSDKDLWHCTWMQPGVNEFSLLLGWQDGNEVVQEIQGLHDRRETWRFSEITDNSFIWRAEVSRDGGKTWCVEQEIRAWRRVSA